jgi:two-component system, NtrC family, sensor kinase
MSYIMSNLSTLTQYVEVFTRTLRLYGDFEQALGPDIEGPPAEVLACIHSLREQEDLGFLLGDVKELLQDALQGSQRVKDIVLSLRLYGRDEAGQPQPVDVNGELAIALKMMWSEFKDRCEVHCDYAQVPPILGYATQLNQVFTNLLSNAAQAIEGPGEVRLATSREGNMVVVRISDTGHGMTPEVRARLFTPFFTTKQPGKGTGLGLSISYGIISRHQGRIEVRSEPGVGTTFTLRFPAAPDAAEKVSGGAA